MLCKHAFALAFAVVTALAVSTASAEVKVGDKAPDFKDIPTIDGKAISLPATKDAKAVVVCFTCNNCPAAIAYEDRFVEFTKKYADKGVKFIAINVNEGEDLTKMKQRAEEKGFNYPYAFDADGATAKAYGATNTPHLFILDADHKVAYIGSFDNSMDAAKADKAYAVNAVDAVLAGKTVEVSKTRPIGCGIKIKK
ncbi:MAG TPA: thioredoxin family protein [Pirellulaceae bacterium]|nr:thioredoxin family protein [Pirellulaceae bacterium]